MVTTVSKGGGTDQVAIKRPRQSSFKQAQENMIKLVKQPTLRGNQTKDLQVKRHICSVV